MRNCAYSKSWDSFMMNSNSINKLPASFASASPWPGSYTVTKTFPWRKDSRGWPSRYAPPHLPRNGSTLF